MADGSLWHRDDDDFPSIEQRIAELEMQALVLRSIVFAAIKLSPTQRAVLDVVETVWKESFAAQVKDRPDLKAYAEPVMQALRDACARTAA